MTIDSGSSRQEGSPQAQTRWLNSTVVGVGLASLCTDVSSEMATSALPALQSGRVVVVEVPEGTEKPYACSDGYFRRLNGTTQKMGHDEIRIMFRENDPLPFEERTADVFSFKDVSPAKIAAFTKEAKLAVGKASAADFLRSLKVADAATVNMTAAGLEEPEFETNGFFRAVFRRSPEFSLKGPVKVGDKVGDKVGEEVGDKFTANQRLIIDFIRAFPTISARQLADKVGISARKIEENIAKLRSKGSLKRVGSNRGGRWEILKKEGA